MLVSHSWDLCHQRTILYVELRAFLTSQLPLQLHLSLQIPLSRQSHLHPPVTTSTPPAMDPDLEDLLSDNTESDCSPPGETIPDESSRLKRTNRDRDRDRGKDVNKELVHHWRIKYRLSEEQKREKRKRTLLD